MTLSDLQLVFRGLPQLGPPWAWERKLLQLILKSENEIPAFDVLQAVIESPNRMIRILPFLGDEDIYKVKTLAATVQPASLELQTTVDMLNSWIARQTVKKALQTNQALQDPHTL